MSDPLPPGFARLFKRSELALLRAEAALLASLTAKVDHATSDAVAMLSAPRGSPATVRARAVAYVVARADVLAAELAAAIAASRTATRRASLAVLRDQLGTIVRLANETPAKGILDAVPAPSREPSADAVALDQAHGLVSGRALAASWASALAAQVVRPSATDATPGDLASAMRDAADRHESRVATTAATENVDAFNGARSEALLTFKVGGYRVLPFIGKHWNATLDRRVCPVCASHSGKTIAYSKSFSGGIAPGCHPNCRCILELIFLPLPVSRAA